MSGTYVVAFVVRCSQSLLLCDDLPTEHLRFTDMAACSAQLPILLAEVQEAFPGQVAMGRCRYLLQKQQTGDQLNRASGKAIP